MVWSSNGLHCPEEVLRSLSLVLRAFCKLDRSIESCTGGNSCKDSLFLGKEFGCFKCILVLYRDDLVINLGVKCVRNKTCADTLDLMRACFSLRKYRRSCRLNSNYLHIRVLALQILTCTGDRSACTNTCYKNIYLSVCVIPDLRACCCCMCLRVSRVLKLSGDEASRNLLGELFCLGNGTLHSLWLRL